MAHGRRGGEWLLVALMAGATGGAWAQTVDLEGGSPGAARQWRLSVDASGAWAASGLFGGVTDPGRGALQLSVHAHLPLIAGPRFALDYTGGIVPVELAVGTRVVQPRTAFSPAPASRTVYGLGVDGLGLTARLVGAGRWEPYLTFLGGVRLFGEPVPDPRGTRFDFSADLGGGVALRLPRDRRARVGVVLHHLSNGGLGRANPSFNAFALALGLEGPFSRP